jgi:hypothetical protein
VQLGRLCAFIIGASVLIAIPVSSSAGAFPGTVLEAGGGYSPTSYGADQSGAPSASAMVLVPAEGRVVFQGGLIALHHKSHGDATFVGAAGGFRYYLTQSPGKWRGVFLEALPSIYAGIWGSTHLLAGFQEGGGFTAQITQNLLVEVEAVYILTSDYRERTTDSARVLEGLNHGVISLRLGLLL